MNPNPLAEQFRAEAATEFAALTASLDMRDWDGAVTAQIGWLFWRAAALSAEVGVEQASMSNASGLLARLINLKAACLTLWADMGDEPATRLNRRKIESVIEMLDALQALVGAFNAADAPNGRARLALAGGEIGRADIMMTMAEAGHWARVFELEQRHLGLYGGSRDRLPAWEEEFEAEAIKIAEGRPVKRADMIRAVVDWHKTYRDQNGKSLNPPGSVKGIGDGIDRLAKKGVITLAHTVTKDSNSVT